jgi:hypothetical protein
MRFEFIRNRVGSPSLLIFAAALLIYPAAAQKIKPAIWHLWNGDTIRFRAYEIPVLTNWVAETDDRGAAILNLSRSYWRGQLHPTIVIFQGIPVSMDAWVQGQKLKFHDEYLKSINAQVFYRRTVDIDGEQADCEATNDMVSQLPVSSDSIITIRCESASGLEIMSTGEKQDSESFFSIVSQNNHCSPTRCGVGDDVDLGFRLHLNPKL